MFSPVEDIYTGIKYGTIFLQNRTLSIQVLLINYMNKVIELKEKVDTSKYRPSLSGSLQQKHHYSEVQNIESKITRHNTPHYWLQQDIIKMSNFQYFQNITPNKDTIPQIEVYSRFRLKFFRFN